MQARNCPSCHGLGHRLPADMITDRLAAAPEPIRYDPGGDNATCLLCLAVIPARTRDHRTLRYEGHDPMCPWRLAVEITGHDALTAVIAGRRAR